MYTNGEMKYFCWKGKEKHGSFLVEEHVWLITASLKSLGSQSKLSMDNIGILALNYVLLVILYLDKNEAKVAELIRRHKEIQYRINIYIRNHMLNFLSSTMSYLKARTIDHQGSTAAAWQNSEEWTNIII